MSDERPGRKKDVAIVIHARLGSERLPRKLVLPFAGTTLIDICMKKAEMLSRVNPHVWFAAHEDELLDRAPAGVKRFRRSAESAASDDPKVITEIYATLKSPHIFSLSPCHPILSVDTVYAALREYAEDQKTQAHGIARRTCIHSMTSVVKVPWWCFDEKGNKINKSMYTSTKGEGCYPIYRAAHAFHIYERERFMKTGQPFKGTFNHPALFTISLAEALDVDTPLDFLIAEAAYVASLGRTGPLVPSQEAACSPPKK